MMSDTERIEQISELIKMAEKGGASSLYDALKIAENIDDVDDK